MNREYTFNEMFEYMNKLFLKIDELSKKIENFEMSKKDNVEILDAEAASLIMKRKPSTLKKMARENKIPHIKDGKKYLFQKSDLLKYLESHKRNSDQFTELEIDNILFDNNPKRR
jgi:excisionase family DNA binding protein